MTHYYYYYYYYSLLLHNYHHCFNQLGWSDRRKTKFYYSNGGKCLEQQKYLGHLYLLAHMATYWLVSLIISISGNRKDCSLNKKRK